MAVDVVLIALLVIGFFVGFFRGVIRGLLALAAWAISFIFAAHLRLPLGDWLARSASFTPFYADLMAFIVIFFLLFVTLLLVILLSRAPTEWSRHQLLDDVLGGAVGVVVVVLTIATMIVMLDSYYAVEQPPPAVDLGWTADIHRAFEVSAVAGFIGNDVVRFIGFLIGILLPVDVRAVMV